MKKTYIQPAIEPIQLADDLCDEGGMIYGSKTITYQNVWGKYGQNEIVFLDDEDAFEEESPTDAMWNNICF